MAEKYGINTRILNADATTPVSTTTCVVFFGGAYNSGAEYGIPHCCGSYKEFLEIYHGGTAPTGMLGLDLAAEYVLNHIDSAWFVNINENATPTTEEDVPSCSSDLVQSAVDAICRESSDIPNILCHAGDNNSETLASLISVANGKIYGVYHAQVFANCSMNVDQLVATSAGLYKPVANKIKPDQSEGCLVAGWGRVILDRDNSGSANKMIHPAIVLATARAVQDASNTQNVPYRSVGNLRISMKGLCIDSSHEIQCDQDSMNALAENGIVSFINKGNNRWYTWGDHTAAVSAGTVDDETYRFDSTVAVIYHIANRFAAKWEYVLDSPMNLRMRDCIIAEEQDYLNGLKAMGCLVGDPRCEFRALDNSSDTLGLGQFYFTNIATIVPPAKYIDLGIQYTSEGLTAYIEG